ncbi:hypothetical protein CPT_Pascal43 [Bacillus phage Pascal]|uniref:Uncharacterized protein n=1 Tax=Bacillus phage Pascal TaxID=1540092 RepID=A0A0A0RVG0_9CAUD|nr:hypothetical protein CPT_Pascal43 [Bacillus phage Pascal]AIW03678.1 hypothetical protein CPT_Pascal43 [Bacillus phage Pascal]
MPGLKKGDKVVMHTCGEAAYHDGKIWTCRTNEEKAGWTGSNVVWLEDYSGAFSTKFLQRVKLGEEK